MLISRATNIQSCEILRNELIQTVSNCDKALNKLNEHINNLKSQKAFKDVQFYLNQLHDHHKNSNFSSKDKESDVSDKEECSENKSRASRKSFGTSSSSSAATRSESLPTKDNINSKNNTNTLSSLKDVNTKTRYYLIFVKN